MSQREYQKHMMALAEELGGKWCRKCGCVKPKEGFARDAHKKDGRRSYCRECTSESNARYRVENRDKVREYAAKWRAKNPERHREYCAKWYVENRERRREYNAKWRAENPERKREYDAKWRAEKMSDPDYVTKEWARLRELKHRRRNAPNEERAFDKAREMLEDADVYGCFWCDTRLEDDEWHWDHVWPLSRRGYNYALNIVWACAPCNLSKGAKPTYPWAVERVRDVHGIDLGPLPDGVDEWSDDEAAGWPDDESEISDVEKSDP